jgi:hypothetical protein
MIPSIMQGALPQLVDDREVGGGEREFNLIWLFPLRRNERDQLYNISKAPITAGDDKGRIKRCQSRP